MHLNPFSLTVVPVALGLLISLLWHWPAPSAFSATQLEDRIVAVVNTDLIMQSDVRHELAPEQERIRQQYHGEELGQRLKTAEYMALTKMIERRLQLQEAKAKSVDVSDQEVKQAIQQMKQQGEKINEKDPLSVRNVRDQLALLKVVDREVRSGVMVGDAEMKRYYKAGGIHAESDLDSTPIGRRDRGSVGKSTDRDDGIEARGKVRRCGVALF